MWGILVLLNDLPRIPLRLGLGLGLGVTNPGLRWGNEGIAGGAVKSYVVVTARLA